MAIHPEPESKPRHTGLAVVPQWAIDHPHVILAFYAGIAILAVIAIGFTMPRRFMPYVQSPEVGIFTMMPGMSAREMEQYVSDPIEQSMTNIEGVQYLLSTSQNGFSAVTLEFPYGYDMKKAYSDIQAQMTLTQGSLPATSANLKPSWVLPIDPLNIPVLSLGVTAKGWDPVRLRQFCDNQVIAFLKRQVPDIYSVMTFGGYSRQLQVIVDRDKLAAHGLSILDVRNAIDRYNVARPAGTLTWGANESIVRVDTHATDAQIVANYPIAALDASGMAIRNTAMNRMPGMGEPGGMGGMAGQLVSAATPPQMGMPTGPLGPAQSPRVIRVKDVARVVDSHWELRSGYDMLIHDPGTKGKIVPAIQVAIVQNPSASSWKVIGEVRKALSHLEHDYPGVKFTTAYDNAHFVGVLFHNMIEELGMAILICGVAIFLFLGEWRGTLVGVMAIPTSLAMAILCLVPLGMSLNSGTLIGLLLSIGRLVDDAIIDVHAVDRHLRMGKSAREATIDGIAEVGRAVLASTFMIVLALAPLLFCGGIVELMFRELVWPLIFGLLASLVVSFTLTALMCASLLRPESARIAERRLLFFRAVVNPFQRFLEGTEHGYQRILRYLLKHRFVSFTQIAATLILGLGFYYFIGSEMMPLADTGQAYGVLEMQPGTSFIATRAATRRIEKMMLQYPQIERVSTKIGAENMFESTGTYFTGYGVPMTNSASFMITLSDMSTRKKTVWQIIDALQKKALAEIPGIRRFQIKGMGSDVMATSAAPIALIVSGRKLSVLDKMGRELARIAKRQGVHQVATDWAMSQPSWHIEINEARAQQLGLSAANVAQQAYYAMSGGLASEYYQLPNLRERTILLRYKQTQRRSPHDLSDMYIAAADGRQVPLSDVATLKYEPEPSLISHDGLRRVISVLGYYRRGEKPSMDLTMAVQMAGMMKMDFPHGYNLQARGDMTQMMDSFRRLLRGLLLAVLFIFLVLAAQFRGFLQPLQMVFSLPLELSGVLFALFLAHQSFSTVSVLGIIVLTGMDATAAVLLVDMIMRYRDRGVPRDESIVAGSPIRLRPILMTSTITILVMIPVAFFPKTGMDAYSPLAVAIIGGLIVGTVLSLFDIPIMHSLVDDLVRWLNHTFLRREWEWPVTESLDDGMVEWEPEPEPEFGAGEAPGPDEPPEPEQGQDSGSDSGPQEGE